MTGGEASAEARAAVERAVDQFNAREFWECHETLEDVWGAEQGPLRDFYHGLIQVAAGFVHVQRRNSHGALRLLAEGAAKLEPFRPVCLRLDLDALLPRLAEWRGALLRSGPDRIGMIDLPLPVMRLLPEASPPA